MINHTRRLFYIWYIIWRYDLFDILLEYNELKLFKPIIWLNPFHYLLRKTSHGIRIRLALESLGPIFVKFGQLLSTRLDLIPEDLSVELIKLQDQVPPFCLKKAKQLIEVGLKSPVNKAFKDFSEESLASASVAQVHAATLKNGDEVIVKVLRPGIEPIIDRDLSLLHFFTGVFLKLFPQAKRFRPHEVIDEFSKTLHDELDLMREAANASQLKRNFKNSPLIYVPNVYWDYTSKSVMVMERIYGTPITNFEQLKAKKVNMKVLAERGVEIFFTQLLRDRFFHADMHPGNIFVSTVHPDSPQYVAVDFGIVGTLSPEDQNYLALNFLAFFNRDYRRVAQLHVESNWVPHGTRVEEFESAIRTVCEPIFERPLKDISVGHTLLRLFQTARRFNMEIQPQLVLLQKTLLTVEGLGRQLYPELDLWSTAKPYLEKWLKQKIGPKAMIKEFKQAYPLLIETLPEIPRLMHQILQNKLLTSYKQNKQQTSTAQVYSSHSNVLAIIASSLIIAAAVILGFLLQANVTLHTKLLIIPAAISFVALIFIYMALKK